MTPETGDRLAEIARAVGYHDGAGWPDDHDDDDCPVDSLIAYKDALEDEVGRLQSDAAHPDPEHQQTDSVMLTATLGNAAMKSRDDVASALHRIAKHLEGDAAPITADDDMIVRDLNGNTVGRFTVR